MSLTNQWRIQGEGPGVNLPQKSSTVLSEPEFGPPPAPNQKSVGCQKDQSLDPTPKSQLCRLSKSRPPLSKCFRLSCVNRELI